MMKELDPELFTFELYEPAWAPRLDDEYGIVPFGRSHAGQIAKCILGYCDASRLRVRPRTNEVAVMCEDSAGKFWFHLLPISLDAVQDIQEEGVSV